MSKTQAQDVVLNEVMSSNATILADEDGDYTDWIELFNNGSVELNMAGWGLSDDLNEPQKWLFPDLSISPGSHLLVFASGKDRLSNVQEWHAAITEGDACRYLNVTSSVTQDWILPAFNDQSWSSGVTGLGYGDEDDATTVSPAQCIYLRQSFTVTDLGMVEKLLLHMDYDDAFVTYLNGVEVARANIGLPGVRPAYNMSAVEPREAQMYQDGPPVLFDLEPFIGILQTGENILATEVHNFGTTSSDLSVIPFLSIGYAETGLSNRQPISILNLPVSGLHSNFKIKSAGEALFLSNQAGEIIDTFEADSIPTDISKGRYPDGSSEWFFFDHPTPIQANNAGGYQDFAASVETSTESGFYNNPISVSLSSAEPNMTIYYTMDGSIPDQNSSTYENPLLISKTTVLRTRILQSGYLPGPVNTQTYFVGVDRALPVISLSTNPDNLWNFNTGIYTMGPNASPEFPHFGANFWQDWEREAHIEFFEDNGPGGFSNGCGIKIFGGWSRGHPQKSLSLFFRGEYGVSSLEYPLFPDLDIQSFEALVLRNSGNDWTNSMMRDGMMGSLVSDIDMDKQAYRPAILYINGEYWGIHNIREKINEHFIATHHSADADNIDLLENNAHVIHGDNEHYLQMMDYIQTHDMTLDASYDYVIQRMEISEFFDYMIAQIYFDNTDWPGNNIKYWRPKTTDGKWRWILYDTDFGFGLFDYNGYQQNTLAFALEENGPDWPNPAWSTLLLRKILENQNLKDQFINYFADHLNLTFESQKVLATIAKVKDQILSDIPDHLARWDHDLGYWNAETLRLNTFAQNRVVYLRMHLQQEFALANLQRVQISLSDSGMGKIEINDHLITAQDFDGYYFPNLQITLKAIANPGFRFSGWSGTYASQSDELIILPNESMDITAHFEQNEDGVPEIVINEINYNSSESFDSGDWVEFVNIGTNAVDLNGWIFKDEDDSHQFVFPVGTVLEPDSFLVLANDETKFRSQYPQVSNYLAGLNFGFSGAGELLRLYDAQVLVADSLTYDDNDPWPEEADGNGSSLELINPSKDNTSPDNWAASSGTGSPGKANSVFSELEDLKVPELIEDFTLGQNYPNPFNPSTVISYSLAAGGPMELSVFNALGQKVITLVNSNQQAGSYSVQFDSGDLASGIYFYKLLFGNKKTMIKKMILMH